MVRSQVQPDRILDLLGAIMRMSLNGADLIVFSALVTMMLKHEAENVETFELLQATAQGITAVLESNAKMAQITGFHL